MIPDCLRACNVDEVSEMNDTPFTDRGREGVYQVATVIERGTLSDPHLSYKTKSVRCHSLCRWVLVGDLITAGSD